MAFKPEKDQDKKLPGREHPSAFPSSDNDRSCSLPFFLSKTVSQK
jgi:hypothetical protein